MTPLERVGLRQGKQSTEAYKLSPYHQARFCNTTRDRDWVSDRDSSSEFLQTPSKINRTSLRAETIVKSLFNRIDVSSRVKIISSPATVIQATPDKT